MKSRPAWKTLSRLPLLGWLCLELLISSMLVDAGDWPSWRGARGDGRSDAQQVPRRWNTNQNVAWRVPLPDRGNSTPIVWGPRLFVTQATEDGRRRNLMCFDRTTGKLLWTKSASVETPEPTHETNPQCAASPAADAERVVAWFGSAGLYCYDHSGNEIWRRELGPQRHIWGNASSPLLHDGLCFLNFGPGEPSFLLAVNIKTGKEIWRINEPNANSGEKKPGDQRTVWVGSWSTPVIARLGAREELLLSWPLRLLALEPKSGQELWSCSGLNPLVYTSPLYDEASRAIVAMGGFSGMALAVTAGGSGDVTESRRLWHHPKTKQRIGSGVIHQGHIYIQNDPGVAECWELSSGKLVWEQRLVGASPRGDSWSSMVLAEDRLYVINQGGDTFVLRASPKFEIVAVNSIGETTMASLVPCTGEMFIRTHKALWRIRETAN